MNGGERFQAGLMEGMEMTNDNGLHGYWAELGDSTPCGCDFDAVIGTDHWFLTPLTGKSLKGRGIKKDELHGWYRVTASAFEKIKKEHSIRMAHWFD